MYTLHVCMQYMYVCTDYMYACITCMYALHVCVHDIMIVIIVRATISALIEFRPRGSVDKWV